MVLAARITAYATFMILGMNIIVAYPAISGWIRSITGIDLPMIVFVFIIGAVLIVGMFIEYKYSLGSVTSFGNEQWYKHGNPMRDYLEERDRVYNEKLDKILARFEDK